MVNLRRLLLYLSVSFLAVGCLSSGIVTSAQESYRVAPNVKVKNKLAVFAMMSAGSSSFNAKSASSRVVSAPYSPSRIIKGSSVSFPVETSMEGFRNAANDIFLESLKDKKHGITIIPPKKVQSIINNSDLVAPYIDFLKNYRYLSANSDFLKKLGKLLDCKHVIISQLILMSNINDNSMSVVWNFGKRSANYSIVIIVHLWDMSSGELVWSGRGSSSNQVSLYEEAASFESLVTKASEELIKVLP